MSQPMNWIVLSDLTSALVQAISVYLHHSGHMGMEAGEQFLSSVIGRWFAAYSDKLGLNNAARDALGVFLTRSVLAMLWGERRWGVKGFDAVLADRVGFLVASLFPQGSLPTYLTEQGMFLGAYTGPVPGSTGEPNK
jgi:hypothetical protein